MLPRRILSRVSLLAFAVPTFALAQVTFSFNYTDSGNGFNDPTHGATRRGALEAVAATLSSYFASYSARTVTFDVISYSGNPDGRLAAAGSGYDEPDHSFQMGYVQDKIINNASHGSGAEGLLIWNFTYAWSYGDSVSASSFDFKAVALHELTHTLGFASLISGSTGAGAGSGTTYTIFDQFLTDAAGNRLVSPAANYVGGTILSNGVGGDVYFSGPNAVAIFGGPVPIYSPATFVEGSSLSHLDTDYFTAAGYVMEHAVSTGLAPRDLSPVELAILTDIGYTITSVPEPASGALLAALVAFCWTHRRRPRETIAM